MTQTLNRSKDKPELTCQYLDPESIINSADFRIIESFLRITKRTQIGWHYIVDLTWIYSQAKHWPVGSRVLDAGGGSGPTQFMLAEMGMDVFNIDLFHPEVSSSSAKRYGLEVKHLDSYVATDYVAHLKNVSFSRKGLGWLRQFVKNNRLIQLFRYKQLTQQHEQWRSLAGYSDRPVGRLTRLSGNLCHMPEILAASFDAVVSLSALEHIPLNILPAALKEINRVLKPDAYCAITTSATEKSTWFHEPSKGLCFSQDDLNNLFGAEMFDETDPAIILEKYRTATYLRDNLADFYKKSGNNGMPWGKWDPQYLPVGIRNMA
jgi:ubiquinone/menaquinone biosynthesis C-methylase UbiE